jgi:hypothetical protein
MTKIEMAIPIASALLNSDVDENNWKVRDLMKQSKKHLESHMPLAEKILNDRGGCLTNTNNKLVTIEF